jgi:hypothetical protein
MSAETKFWNAIGLLFGRFPGMETLQNDRWLPSDLIAREMFSRGLHVFGVSNSNSGFSQFRTAEL